MERNGVSPPRLCIVGFYLCFATICFVHSDATNAIHRYRTRKHFRSRPNTKWTRKNHFHALRKFDTNMAALDDASNTDPYVSSPLSLPPYDALPPFSLPQNTPPYCINPPSTPSPIGGYTPLPPPGPSPSPNPPESTPVQNPPTVVPNPPTTGPTPTEPVLSPPSLGPSPPEGTPIPNPPTIVPNPPTTSPTPTEPVLGPPFYEPSPPEGTPIPTPPSIVPSPPDIVSNPPTTGPTPTEPVLGPPFYEPSPPYSVPSPAGLVPRSPRFLPPIVYPPPAVPPPPFRVPTSAMWCVAKPAVPGPIIQEAMNYACGSGADCDQIQPNGSCFQPDTLFAHASYAFNSYWQRTKATGGMCDFGGTAILVTIDPSYDGCHFIYF